MRFAQGPEQAKTPTINEEDEEDEEVDEATRAFLATSIAPSLSQLELRTLLKVAKPSA